ADAGVEMLQRLVEPEERNLRRHRQDEQPGHQQRPDALPAAQLAELELAAADPAPDPPVGMEDEVSGPEEPLPSPGHLTGERVDPLTDNPVRRLLEDLGCGLSDRLPPVCGEL